MFEPARRTRSGHRALALLFGGLGVLGGAWGAHIPSLKAAYGLSERDLAWALAAAAVGALSSLFFSGRLIARLGTRHALWLTGVAMQLGLALALHWPHPLLMGAALWALGMAMSVHDVALNAEGTALEAALQRPIMGGLHAFFSLGAMAGALLSAGMLALGWPAGLQLALVAAALMAATAALCPRLLDAHPAEPATEGDGENQRHFLWPRGPLLLIGLLIFAGMLAEGVMYDWSVLHLQQSLAWPQDRAALGYAVFVGAMAATRFAADRLRARWGDERLLVGSAALAAAAMALGLLWPHPVGSLVAYAGVGMGLAPVVPLLYTAAARVPGSTSAAALAAVSSIGYAGFVVGPPLIGFLAEATSLATAMWTVATAAAVLAAGSLQLSRPAN